MYHNVIYHSVIDLRVLCILCVQLWIENAYHEQWVTELDPICAAEYIGQGTQSESSSVPELCVGGAHGVCKKKSKHVTECLNAHTFMPVLQLIEIVKRLPSTVYVCVLCGQNRVVQRGCGGHAASQS